MIYEIFLMLSLKVTWRTKCTPVRLPTGPALCRSRCVSLIRGVGYCENKIYTHLLGRTKHAINKLNVTEAISSKLLIILQEIY
jgi:hypothetical protein